MDKERLKKLLKDVDQLAVLLDESFPKARNRVNSLRWALKEALKEVETPDTPPAPTEEK